jgi:transposase
MMIQQQQSMNLSAYTDLYNIVVPQDHMLRKMNELIDFSFVYEELVQNYCLVNGRNAISPIRMFKYLLLKTIYDISDVDVVERSHYDMSFKYFLEMAPEDPVIEPSSLTKFRKLRLKDLNILDLLIGKTVEVALKKGMIQDPSIIVDAAHTKACYNQQTPQEILRERFKKLRKAVYKIDENVKKKFPAKTTTDQLEDEISYSQELIEVMENGETLKDYPKVKQELNYLKETVQDDTELLEQSNDQDARMGHKSADRTRPSLDIRHT